MSSQAKTVFRLSELIDGQEADTFALLSNKQQLSTRDGNPYTKVTFRDADREVSFPIWSDSALSDECRESWQVGAIYKIRGTFRESEYGPQLDIARIRLATEQDADDGFDPDMMLPRTRFVVEAMYNELTTIAKGIKNDQLSGLVREILTTNRDQICAMPAATRNHHAIIGGFLEHVLSVTRTCVYLADKYADYYADMNPPLDKGVVVAGAILHDIGKLQELAHDASGFRYTPSGHLIGHILQGRDIVRRAAENWHLDDDTLLRLEHVIVAHQRLPEWGSPKPPMTPEALIVHYADDMDAKIHMMYQVLRNDSEDGPLTSSRNALRQRVYRGESKTPSGD